MTFRTKALRVIVIAMFFWALSSYCSASGQSSLPQRKAYALQTWSNLSCRAKGRFQDREYCSSAVIDQIVADGKSSIPVLISQITDSRWIAEPVYDYWPRIRTGELAYFILDNCSWTIPGRKAPCRRYSLNRSVTIRGGCAGAGFGEHT